MGKYTSVAAGSVVVVLGIAGLIAWRHDFVAIVKGTLPIMCVFGGVIALIAGLSEIKDEKSAKKEEAK